MIQNFECAQKVISDFVVLFETNEVSFKDYL